jgi:hypothetical protein
VLDVLSSPAFLGISGGACEVVGLLLVVSRASRELRHRFGEVGKLRSAARWIRRTVFEGPPEPVSAAVRVPSAIANADGGNTAVLTGETQIDRLDRELSALTSRVAQHEARTAKENAELHRRFADNFNDLNSRVQAITESDDATRRNDLRREVQGARIFILGAVLSALANVV